MSNDAVFAPVAIPVIAETAEAVAQGDAARSRGYAAGYADGLRAAAEEQQAWLAAADADREADDAAAAERLAVLAAALRNAAIELRESTVPVLAEAENSLVEAAFSLAQAVVGDALANRVAAANAAVSRVLGGDVAGAVSVVRLNPEDLAAIGQGAAGDAVRLVADPALAPGDAIGELPDGWLDARIHSAMDRAREALG
ncbi:FliH/SctL family protein [Leifsonia sp. NPDC102414]|uniref:FliH/SctL family protein n=1 Tax=Leifsonia sp. NPDC102414 TaxID=3364124 RepID=UPI003830ACD0